MDTAVGAEVTQATSCGRAQGACRTLPHPTLGECLEWSSETQSTLLAWKEFGLQGGALTNGGGW